MHKTFINVLTKKSKCKCRTNYIFE